jgi:hypothetical protein
MITSERRRGPSSKGDELDEEQGAKQMDMEGNRQMDMDNDDEHETDVMETTDGHETGDSIVPGSRCKARRKSHVIMPLLVTDSEDGNIVIKPTGDT